jgi:hypothetical protein
MLGQKRDDRPLVGQQPGDGDLRGSRAFACGEGGEATDEGAVRSSGLGSKRGILLRKSEGPKVVAVSIPPVGSPCLVLEAVLKLGCGVDGRARM